MTAPVAVVTLGSAARLDHVCRQQRLLRAEAVRRVLVWLDAEPPPSALGEFAGADLVHVPPGEHGLRLAAGRNRGARAADADLLVFLDADCLPGPDLLARYRAAAREHPRALLCGPVTYLPEGIRPERAEALPALTAPHPARPAPPAGENVVGGPYDHRLFWSLSFAVTANAWASAGGFHETYQGYGGEDTDLACTARRAGLPLVWVGGAHAYHQHHPTSSPPWQHLDDILRNGRIFADRWGFWPMRGWLDAFAAAGAIELTPAGWRRSAAGADPSRLRPGPAVRGPPAPSVRHHRRAGRSRTPRRASARSAGSRPSRARPPRRAPTGRPATWPSLTRNDSLSLPAGHRSGLPAGCPIDRSTVYCPAWRACGDRVC